MLSILIFLCISVLQKFRFCGDLDCPDWVLAEISILSKIVSDVLLHNIMIYGVSNMLYG